MKRQLDEATASKIYATLLEKFGEPIGKAVDRGQGVADERGGHPHKGPPMGNRGFGAALDEEEKDSMRTCPSCKGTGRVDSVRQHRTLRMKCPTCKGHGLVKKINEDLTPGEVNEPTCQGCGGMLPLESTSCNQCGMMSTHMDESEGGGRHPGHASSCTCPDCSRPEVLDPTPNIAQARKTAKYGMLSWANDQGNRQEKSRAARQRKPKTDKPMDEQDLDEKAPPGGEKLVKALKKQKDVKDPYAVAWAMKNRRDGWVA